MMKTYSPHVIAGGLLFVFTCIFIQNAWLVDDAYITFRTVQNVLHGHGLTWNIGERVQVYSHPLWMGVLVLVYALCGSLYATLYGTSLVAAWAALCTTGASLWKHHREEAVWRGALFMLLVLTSKSIIDYTSSGLENVLGYLLTAAFTIRFLYPADSKKQLFTLWLLASLTYLNRSDSVLIVSLPLLAATWWSWRVKRTHTLAMVALGLAPAGLWTLFSLWYYGLPFPNTAYAKALKAKIPFTEKLIRGADYLTLSIEWNATTLIAIVVAGIYIAKERNWRGIWVLAGTLLYLLFTLTGGAAATHMGGRFLALPLFVGSVLLAHTIKSPRVAQGIALFCLGGTLLSAHAPWKAQTPFEGTALSAPQHIDTRYLVHENEKATLVDVLFNDAKRSDNHGWLLAGKHIRRRRARVHVGGAHGWDAVGYFGFAAGEERHIIDTVALTDPFLSKLPSCVRFLPRHWRSGHMYRLVPEGYPESIHTGTNAIKEPYMRIFYGHILTMTQGDLDSWERLKVIAKYNLGAYDNLLDPYRAEIRERFSNPRVDCSPIVRQQHGPYTPPRKKARTSPSKRDLKTYRK